MSFLAGIFLFRSWRQRLNRLTRVPEGGPASAAANPEFERRTLVLVRQFSLRGRVLVRLGGAVFIGVRSDGRQLLGPPDRGRQLDLGSSRVLIGLIVPDVGEHRTRLDHRQPGEFQHVDRNGS